MKVSVVIPVFNVEPYVEECLRSVMNQTLSDIEIICIEDCGQDGSKDIIKRLMNEDSRISLFVNEKNQGLAAVRNQGMERASGEYIYFLDSDDMIKEDTLRALTELAASENLDVCIFSADFIFEDEKLAERFGKDPAKYKGTYPDVMSGKELYKKWMKLWDWMPSQPRYFYRRQFLEENEIRFVEGQLHEDESFAFDVLMKAERVRVINEPYFIRRFRKSSIMSGGVTMKNVQSCLQIIDHVMNHATEDEELRCAMDYYVAKLIRDTSNKYRAVRDGKKKEIEILFDRIKRKSRIELYACSSYYQVFIAIVKAMYEDKMIELVLEEHGIETADELSRQITYNLPEYVNKVYVCPDSEAVDPYEQKETAGDKELSEKLVTYVEGILGIRKEDGGINWNPEEYYEKINVFWDLGYVGTYLNIKGIKYTLHEDSLNSYKKIRENRPNYHYIFDEKERLSHKGVLPFGYSKYCQAVEVNDISGIQIPTEKVVECSREKMIEALDSKQRSRLMDAFIDPDIMENIITDEKTLLLLTEPFAVTGRLPDETSQERLYKDIVREYGQGKRLIIKAHPRDVMDYKKVFPEALVIEKNLPMEILNFDNRVFFDTAVTVTSSVIQGLTNVGEKKLLGAVKAGLVL